MPVEPQPQPKPAKNRLFQDGRDMFWSLVPLVVVCVALAGILGRCSFAPTGPGRSEPPPFDVAAALQSDADALAVPVRMPRLPDDWRANSGRRDGIEAGRTDPATGRQVRAVSSTVGYLAPSGLFVSLTQTDADEDALLASLPDERTPTGTRKVGDRSWVVYEGGEDVEPAWTTAIPAPGAARLLITGAAGEDDFRTLAAAVQDQPPLKPRP
ncbi:DUF4245 domain-containing protein [Mycobacterium sp. MYCO198283]|uniref:DUF4245 domain-containing protein n=1 Tax=Mycobacterium sp. MYCO198283 TaxID=2883505 RepID=UPI001E2B1F4E|nr:DUF4245 domain-containing protein [Mycobacterium sp. MYCO198283]MCG5430857.1 DUF4245 domain-containing protein [Mycobacterium sp. MYCO198283]